MAVNIEPITGKITSRLFKTVAGVNRFKFIHQMARHNATKVLPN